MKLQYRVSLTAVTLLAMCAVVHPVHAQLPYALSGDGAAVVRVMPQSSLPASSLSTSALTTGWTATAGSGGSLSVTSYGAGYRGGAGGAEIKALYSNGSALAAGQGLEWVQVINTNDALGTAISPYLDNALNPSQPFYSLTNGNRDPTLPANKLNFYDFSTRNPADLSSINPITWSASLYPVVTNGTKALTVQNGVTWGWTMKKATVGADTGTFVNPSPSTAVVSGVGTNSFSWGQPSPDSSSLTFTGAHFDTTPGTPFVLGHLTFHNGTILGGTGADSVGFKTSVSFDNIPEKNFDLSSLFDLVNTPNTDDPIASADSVTLDGYGYTFNVLEGATASVDLMATLTTNLTGAPSGGTPSGAAEFSPQPFDPDPSYVLRFTGFANPSAGGFITNQVPEPSAGIIVLAGLLVSVAFTRKRWHKARL